ncbi:tyrosine-type recombinase/integrase [Pigmentiphaga kullae]|uniref:Phage integrase family protein n=1 Tax=Pigmentiphaga kullae TaxID=151784 RepID=A0A4Q7NC58_9BURK|nr:tyrosine-type recombinase/integrase [Pigmentiphaga kullae]RZS80602.1 phage integrase family protein [Pigmentiphaga kullae]
MANVRRTPAGRFELTISSKLLPRRVYLTFDTEREAREYGEQCAKWFRVGIVPEGLIQPVAEPAALLGPLIRAWVKSGHPSKSDVEILDLLFEEVGSVQLRHVTYAWAESWVQRLKHEKNLSPGTIRKRVQALGKVLDWVLRKTPDVMAGNPLKLLPRGYSTYNEVDAEILAAKQLAPKIDIERDRRLSPGEEGRILAALDGEKRADRERPLTGPDLADLRVLFLLIVNCGLRLREAYQLRRGWVDFARRVLRVQSSKQWRGRVKFREVPMTPVVHGLLTGYLAASESDSDALVFPFWNGDPETLAAVTSRLSHRFSSLFSYAGCEDLTEHDLRHEATCRWFEMRSPDGHWLLRDAEIIRIMGWAPGSSMAARYASFRADDMTNRLWAGH